MEMARVMEPPDSKHDTELNNGLRNGTDFGKSPFVPFDPSL
jgi:hypothetical protein